MLRKLADLHRTPRSRTTSTISPNSRSMPHPRFVLHITFHGGICSPSVCLSRTRPGHCPTLLAIRLPDVAPRKYFKQVDPQEIVVNYSTGSGMRPIPVSFCVMSSATGNCTSDSMIDLQDPATQVKLAKSNNGKGPTPSFAECLYGASNGGADPITMDAFIEHCGRGTFALSHLSPL